MTLRQPSTAILTITLLAAASANPAWADCEQLRQQLVGQYGVIIRYSAGYDYAARQCAQLRTKLVIDTTALTKCEANVDFFFKSYNDAVNRYVQIDDVYLGQCNTTAYYGDPKQPAAPPYATETSPYKGEPSVAQPIPQPTPPDPTTAENPTNQDVINQDLLGDLQAVGGILGAGRGGRGGGGRGGGTHKIC